MTQPPPGWTTHAEVVRVIDGDTVRVKVTREVDVRLEDCWAAELRQPGGEEARQALLAMCLGYQCIVHIPASDDDQLKDIFTFGRVVGRLFVNGQDLSELMVREGHATAAKQDNI